MRRLFVNESSELSFDQFRSLYKINFSPQGANDREKEEDTIFTFESFIMDSAGQLNSKWFHFGYCESRYNVCLPTNLY